MKTAAPAPTSAPRGMSNPETRRRVAEVLNGLTTPELLRLLAYFEDCHAYPDAHPEIKRA